MNQRLLLFGILFPAVVATSWLLWRLSEQPGVADAEVYHDPDYYMEDFSTLTMEDDGSPKNKLYAVYMAHYPDDTSELIQPKLEMFRADRPPLYVTADKGWVASSNEVILLRGSVRLWEDDEQGVRKLQVDTSEARVLMDDEYAETDKPARIVTNNSTITGTGMRAWLKDGRLEVIDHELTVIDQGPDG